MTRAVNPHDVSISRCLFKVSLDQEERTRFRSMVEEFSKSKGYRFLMGMPIDTRTNERVNMYMCWENRRSFFYSDDLPDRCIRDLTRISVGDRCVDPALYTSHRSILCFLYMSRLSGSPIFETRCSMREVQSMISGSEVGFWSWNVSPLGVERRVFPYSGGPSHSAPDPVFSFRDDVKIEQVVRV